MCIFDLKKLISIYTIKSMSMFRKVVKKMFAELSNRDKIKLQFKSNLRMINKIRQKNNRQQVRIVLTRNLRRPGSRI